MPRQKMPPEYFLNRIRDFHKLNARAPLSADFNGPFHKNIMTHFGSWQRAVDAALGVKLKHARKTDTELLAEISGFVAANNRIPNRSELKYEGLLCNRFGSYAQAIEAAIHFNPQTAIMQAIELLTSKTPCASLYELGSAVGLFGKPITIPQLRGFIDNLAHLGFVEVQRGDRIALYKLTINGKKELKVKGLKHAD